MQDGGGQHQDPRYEKILQQPQKVWRGTSQCERMKPGIESGIHRASLGLKVVFTGQAWVVSGYGEACVVFRWGGSGNHGHDQTPSTQIKLSITLMTEP